jgi:hypothetical protein
MGIDMKTLKSFKNVIVWFLVIFLAVPPPVFAQDSGATIKKFSQEELDQMLAPIALYPDSLLGQVLIASTYPLEVVLADRWVKQNKNLKGDALNDALDRQNWDASVKALVPFPEVLSMMSEKTEWTQNLGDAFLSQQDDVMDTVQKLREKAYNAGNLKTTEQQVVVVEREIIRVEPANPEVVYVPVYDPRWVYGPWWWPAYPPYVIYPYSPGFVIAPGFISFGLGFVVGAFWTHAWGHWDWQHHHVIVSTNRSININRRNINVKYVPMGEWRHDPVHRRGVAYRDPHTRDRYRQIDRGAVNSRRDFRGFEGVRPAGRVDTTRRPGVQTTRPGTVTGRVAQPGAVSGTTQRPGTQVTKPGTQAAKPGTQVTRPGTPAAKPGTQVTRPGTPTGKVTRPEATVSRPATERAPGGPSDRSAIERGKAPQAFQGMGKGNEVRRQSSWGQNSRNASKAQVAPRAAPSVQPRGTGGAPKAQAAPKGGSSVQPKGGDIRGGAGGAAPGGRR